MEQLGSLEEMSLFGGIPAWASDGATAYGNASPMREPAIVIRNSIAATRDLNGELARVDNDAHLSPLGKEARKTELALAASRKVEALSELIDISTTKANKLRDELDSTTDLDASLLSEAVEHVRLLAGTDETKLAHLYLRAVERGDVTVCAAVERVHRLAWLTQGKSDTFDVLTGDARTQRRRLVDPQKAEALEALELAIHESSVARRAALHHINTVGRIRHDPIKEAANAP